MHEPEASIGLIASLALLVALSYAYGYYNDRCQERFGVKPLNMDGIVLWIILLAAICYGDTWRRCAAATGRDGSTALLLMGLGTSGAIASLIVSLRRTNTVYGLAGTALKFASALPFFLFAYYTTFGWLFLWGLLVRSDNTRRPGRPYPPQPDEANWNDPRWNDPRWSDPRWANLYWDDPRTGLLPWNDPRWNDPTLKHPRYPS